MKRFIFFLIFVLTVPILTFSQTEQQQKHSIRSQNPSSNSNTTRVTSNEIFQKQEIRRETQQPKSTVVYNQFPTWNSYNRWNRWGAPFHFNSFYPYDYYDRWGYRRPARIYERENGKLDTILSKKNKFRFGLNISTNNHIGGWFTLGKSLYFKGSFNKIISTDKSEFYNHPDVNFYNANSVWNDQRLDDILKGWSTYFGFGREFKNFGVNMSVGLGSEQTNYQFFDETNILSNNGNYSFKNFVDNYVSVSVGITHDYKFLSVSADYDPIRKTFWLGTGFNF
jgi:hypothetical protein